MFTVQNVKNEKNVKFNFIDREKAEIWQHT